MVFYRKYRPQTVSELDSAKLRETLTAVLSREEVPHAFLFTGPKGLGKTSTARIIAKVVNCENKKKGSIEPCDACEMCVSITNGNNMDVLEIDGASNRGIDEIRDLRDKVKLAPSRAKKKVYIIDEVHMLTTEAFNALLKTIEEPPSHVMFLFCTTEPQKVPATILSRCFHVSYTLATEDDLVRSFKRIVEGEKIDIDDEALHMIARLSEGGFRDGTKILEELVMVAGDKKIDTGFVDAYYKTSNTVLLLNSFLSYLAAYNAVGSLHVIEQLIEQGADIKYFIAQILTKLNDILLAQMGVKGEIASYPENLRFEPLVIQSLVTLFSDAYAQTKYAVIPQLPLELAVVMWCIPGEDSEKIIFEQGGRKPFATPRSDGKHTMETLLKKEKNLKVQALLRGTNDEKQEKTKTEDNEELQKKNPQEVLSEKAASEQFMENLIYKMKSVNFSVAGVLRGCIVKKLAGDEVIFQTAYAFHKEKLDETKTKDVLEKAIKEITGKTLRVVVELKK